MQREGEKQTQCSESAFNKLVQKGAEQDFEKLKDAFDFVQPCLLLIKVS